MTRVTVKHGQSLGQLVSRSFLPYVVGINSIAQQSLEQNIINCLNLLFIFFKVFTDLSSTIIYHQHFKWVLPEEKEEQQEVVEGANRETVPVPMMLGKTHLKNQMTLPNHFLLVYFNILKIQFYLFLLI